jgi:putative transposase
VQSRQLGDKATGNRASSPEDPILRRVYRYRLYPTKTQERKLLKQLELARRVYNKALWWREGAWQREKRRVTLREQTHALVELKRNFPEYAEISPGVLVDVLKRVDLAFKAFFRRVQAGENPGHPRAKGPGWYKSITLPRRREFKLKHSRGKRYGYLSFKGFSNMRVRMHRDVPAGATVRRVIVKREPTGHWYAMLGWDRENVQPPEHPHKASSVGLHPGLSSYLSTDTGEAFKSHKAYRRHRRKLAKRQRVLARRRMGSNRREKQRVLVAKQHAKIAGTRHDFQHNLSCRLAKRYGKVFVSKLEVRTMLSDGELDFLNVWIADAAWSTFLHMLRYKAASAGSVYMEVDATAIAQACSCCGQVATGERGGKKHECPFCGLTLPHGVNAARNVKRRAVLALQGGA